MTAGSSPPPEVSVVVRCRNEAAHIGKLLYGIERQRFEGAVETIVVDSGSTDATLGVAERFPVRIVHIRPEEFSFGRALNVGAAVARGRFLVFASAHVFPLYDDWLTTLLRPFALPDVALSYGRQVGADTSRYSERQVFRQWFPERSVLRQDTPFCNNANAAVRRELWEAEPYDESLTGLEDLDWARRIKAKGHHVSYVAEAVVVHVHDETPRQTMNRYRREAIALKHIYPEQELGPLDYVSLFLSNTASDYLAAAREGEALRHLTEIPVFRAMQFAGAFRGFRQKGPITDRLRRTFYYPPGAGGPDGPGAPSGDRDVRAIDYSGGKR